MTTTTEPGLRIKVARSLPGGAWEPKEVAAIRTHVGRNRGLRLYLTPWLRANGEPGLLWHVTEYTTGYAVTKWPENTQEEAKAHAAALLRLWGDEQLQERLRLARERTGILNP